jgi:4-amino-4-deoxy-L-arabinose transferase-like glycosyltransferase
MGASRRTIGLVLLGGLALGLRVWLVLALSTEHAAPLTYEHGRIAENLLAGRGFTIEFLGVEGPTSQQAPFYPLLLAAAYRCFGIATPDAILAVQLLQCVAGAALVLAVIWLGRVLAPDRPGVAWVAGLGAAIYPPHLYMVTHLQVAVWAALILTTLLALVMSPRWRGTRGGAILAGCLAGLLLLVEPILALALPICAAAFWMGHRSRRWSDRFRAASLGRVALMTGIAAAIISPWVVRNWLVHGEFVFIKSTFGYAFWQGNNPASWGTDKVPKGSAEQLRLEHDGTLAGMDRALWEARHETVYVDDVLLKPTGYREFAGLSEPERSRLLGRRALEFIRAEPDRYARLCVRRLRYFLLFDETNPKAANRVYRAATVTWLFLALVGLLISRDRWRRLWPTYAIFAAVTLFHALVIVSARFRIPLEPFSFVWAAWAVEPLLGRLAPERQIKVYRPGERPGDPLAPEHPALRTPDEAARTDRRAA